MSSIDETISNFEKDIKYLKTKVYHIIVKDGIQFNEDKEFLKKLTVERKETYVIYPDSFLSQSLDFIKKINSNKEYIYIKTNETINVPYIISADGFKNLKGDLLPLSK